ncbi:hypothetical protein [Nocardia caishijiensis]|uniref:Zinc finger protein n=1 Tax=Nocardia caishijiensis TaxID=184756 RepID=A0ABQ6YJY9_9NOCA|nr:hypothetical protein [Nocardia caishijiensis]KAF0845746.1 hypothetical protein FNL39_106134 [Nocardia caishijiensis]
MTDPTPTMLDALLADTSPYLSCDECFDRIDIYVERRLADPGYDDPAMRIHLAGCGACAEEERTLRELLAQDLNGS